MNKDVKRRLNLDDDQAFLNQEMGNDKMQEEIGQGLALSSPVSDALTGNEQDEQQSNPEKQGWAEDSDDISISDDEIRPLEDPIQD